MKMKSVSSLYKIECYIFKGINRYFDQKTLNVFFRTITHIGGAIFSISLVLCLLIFSKGTLQSAAAVSLTMSHIPVQILKRWYPRKRPYLTIQNAKYPSHPLKDHSFPSGHTTAIFSVITPFICYDFNLLIALLPLALCIGVSRIYLGLHYPSDVFVGMCLGTCSGLISFYQFIPLFL
ncbi:phosphatase PAP2 family protein [Bacillus cytotoxicus]|uniref:phosphatase PAP2 family protein n=1 Tax=Bacillus cereus group sp. BfR-BA-01492 TaxID=2920361 RepID=UPI001F562725|nr:phosphatase PAP2 family protein [Bacillus cereus group sp. BfR-BA-01492]EMA6344672.1 phosphatase PAP2 family protein [Bacillus cytotoxicus]